MDPYGYNIDAQYQNPALYGPYQGYIPPHLAIESTATSSPFSSPWGTYQVKQGGKSFWVNTGNNGESYQYDEEGRKYITLANGQRFYID